MFSCVHFRRTAMMPGLFDEQFLLRKLDEEGDPLARLNSIVDWKIFLPILENALGAKDCSSAGRKPYPPLFMFKILILQSLYNLPDGRVERLLTRDLLARRFVGLSGRDLPPDFTTICRPHTSQVSSLRMSGTLRRTPSRASSASCSSLLKPP